MRQVNARFAGFVVISMVTIGLLIPSRVFAQAATLTPETVAGKYKGTVTLPDGSNAAMTVELRVEKGALVGSGQSEHGPFTITAATITGDKVTMSMDFQGMAGTLAGVMKGGHVEGTWTVGETSGSYSLDKEPAGPDAAKPAAPSAATATAAKAGDPITGTWDGVTGQGDQTVPFVLTLKLDGEKVTGEVSSEQGAAPLAGAWKDGALSFTFDYAGMGTISMAGGLKEGKLIGTLDIGGQMQMPWAAVKRTGQP